MRCTDCFNLKITKEGYNKEIHTCVLSCAWIIFESASKDGADIKCRFFKKGKRW